MKWLFRTGVSEDTKLMDCPGCHEKACHWIGGSPHDIECLNKFCDYFKLPPGYKKKPNTVTTIQGVFVPPGKLKYKMIKASNGKNILVPIPKDAVRKAVKKIINDALSVPYYVPPGPIPEITLEDLCDKKPENWCDK